VGQKFRTVLDRAEWQRKYGQNRPSRNRKPEPSLAGGPSEPGEGALKFRAPDGTVAEIVGVGRYNKKKAEKAPT
jgi:hypothetical protein